MREEDAADGLCIDDLAVLDHPERFIPGEWMKRQRGFAELEALTPGGGAQPTRDEDMEYLGAESGRRMDRDQGLPRCGGEPRFFFQFPLCARDGRFLVFELSCRQLVQPIAGRMPILTDQQDPAVVKDRQNHSSARMDRDLSIRLAAVRIFDLIHNQTEDAAREELLGFQDLVVFGSLDVWNV